MSKTITWSAANSGLCDSIEVYVSDVPITMANKGTPAATLGPTETTYVWTGDLPNKIYNCALMFIKGTDNYLTRSVPFSTYATTGPGSQTVKRGDWNFGYFGRVPATDILAYADLRTALNITIGSTIAVAGQFTEYGKFVMDGKILFVPMGATANNTSWEQMYNLGLMYGVDGPGSKPTGLSIADVNQLKTFTAGGFKYLARTPKGSTIPVNQPVSMAAPAIEGSEFDRLFASIILPASKPPYEYIRFTDNPIAAKFALITQHITVPASKYYLIRGSASDPIAATQAVAASGTYYWTPVLELQP